MQLKELEKLEKAPWNEMFAKEFQQAAMNMKNKNMVKQLQKNIDSSTTIVVYCLDNTYETVIGD